MRILKLIFVNKQLPRIHCPLNMSHTDCTLGVPHKIALVFALISVEAVQSFSLSEVTVPFSTPRKTRVDRHLDGRLMPHFRVWVLKFWNYNCPSFSPSGIDPMTQKCPIRKNVEHFHKNLLMLTNTCFADLAWILGIVFLSLFLSFPNYISIFLPSVNGWCGNKCLINSVPGSSISCGFH